MQNIQSTSLNTQTITCSYGTPCIVSLEKNNNEKVLKLDFNIKQYKICNGGWKDFNFPEDIVINDVLYLNEEVKDNVIKVLDCFIETEYLRDVEHTSTNRGFALSEFKDMIGNTISIQESSAAMAAYIWFGCDTKGKVFTQEGDKLVPYKYPSGDHLVSDRMHLNVAQCVELKEMLQDVWNQ
jgi:hypothetical protein